MLPSRPDVRQAALNESGNTLFAEPVTSPVHEQGGLSLSWLAVSHDVRVEIAGQPGADWHNTFPFPFAENVGIAAGDIDIVDVKSRQLLKTHTCVEEKFKDDNIPEDASFPEILKQSLYLVVREDIGEGIEHLRGLCVVRNAPLDELLMIHPANKRTNNRIVFVDGVARDVSFTRAHDEVLDMFHLQLTDVHVFYKIQKAIQGIPVGPLRLTAFALSATGEQIIINRI